MNMSTSDIEKILRNPPAVKPPVDLLADLQRQIVMPKPTPAIAVLPFWKRWLPALSFGLLVLGCIIALGIQTSSLIQLKRENQMLQEQIAQANATPDLQANTPAEAGLTEQEQQEIERLRAEAEQLQGQMQAANQLRTEHAQLDEQLKAATARQRDDDPFAAHKARAETLACINNLKQIGLAARIWANKHKEDMPPDLFTVRDQLQTPKVLVCPADTARLPAPSSWEEWTPSRVTYEYFGAGVSETNYDEVLTRCPIHGNAGLNDGSAIMGAKLVNENGRLKFPRSK